MSRRIAIATNAANATKEFRDDITRLLEGKGWSIWHWFEDLWLVSNAPDDLSLAALRQEIRQMTSDRVHVMIFTVDEPLAYAGWLPEKSGAWLDEKWWNPRAKKA